MPRISHLASLRQPRPARNARELRSQMTDAEQKLWYRLRAERLEGWKFRRQVPVGSFVADFVCERARLIVEVDGGQHAEHVREDAARTEALRAYGYRVIRFWNGDVLGNVEGVLEAIVAELR